MILMGVVVLLHGCMALRAKSRVREREVLIFSICLPV